MTSCSNLSQPQTPQTLIGRGLQYPIVWKPYLCKKHTIDPVHFDYIFPKSPEKGNGSAKTANAQNWSPHSCYICHLLPFQVIHPEPHSDTLEVWSFSIVNLHKALQVYMGIYYGSERMNDILDAGCALQIDTKAGLFLPGHASHPQNGNELVVARVIDPSCIEFSQVRGWIEDCRENHKLSCATETNPHAVEFFKSLPVIDCDSGRIVVLPKGQNYLALSYVWGSPIKAGVMTESLTDLDVKKCPRTIQDSIQVTRSLGYQYLWIDRYCIDQSNAVQKSYQLAMMDHIYENATLTLVAAAGLDDRHGLPGAGTLPLVPRIQQTLLRCNDSPLIQIGLRIENALQGTKWARRGWTYQEMFLSAKCLFFTEKQVVLACRRSVYYEDLSYSDSITSVSPLLKPNENLSVTDLEIHIARYMKRSLTYQHDALNAFKGILSRCSFHSYWGVPLITSQKEPSDETTSVSTSAFLLGLGWQVSRGTGQPSGTVQISRYNTMPSWSWVSLTSEYSQIRFLADPRPSYSTFKYRDLIYRMNGPLQIRTPGVHIWLPTSRDSHQPSEAWAEFVGMGITEHRKVIGEFAPLLKIDTSFWEVRAATFSTRRSGEVHLFVQDIDIGFPVRLDTEKDLDELKDATREHDDDAKDKKVTNLRWRVLMISQWTYNSEDHDVQGSTWSTVFLVVRPSGTYWERVGCCTATIDMDVERAKANRGDFVLC